MSAHIVGRGAELQQVAALLADEAPTVRALVLTGDAGVGKTTIWDEGVRLAGERDMRVLVARPAEAEAADRLAVSRAVLGLLRGLAARDGPLVVGIDDVQWLDTPTEHVLAFVLR